MLDGVLNTEISNYNKVNEDQLEDECSPYYNILNVREDSIIVNIIDQLTEQYTVDEKPICNAYSVCYNFASNDNHDGNISSKLYINKGKTYNNVFKWYFMISIYENNTIY